MPPTSTDGDGRAEREPRRARAWARNISRLLYYLTILLGMVLLYGRGGVSTTGFIYQAF